MSDAAKITLTKAEIKALTAFASKDLTQPQLCAVLFEPEHGTAIATDGHTLVRRTGQKTAGVDFLVFAEDLATAAKLCKPKDVVEVTPTALLTGGVSVPVRYVDAKFPPYREILNSTPAGKRVDTIGVSAYYLARLVPVADACGGRQGLRLTPCGELDPIKFECSAVALGANWDGVIMPMRI